MSVLYCTTAAAAVAARERQRFRMPIYTMASNNLGTDTTCMVTSPSPSCCIYELWKTAGILRHKWELLKVGGEWKTVDIGKTLNVESDVANAVGGCDAAKSDGDERHDNEAGPSGVTSGTVNSGEVEGTGTVKGRPVINRIFLEQLFEIDSDDSDSNWVPDEGFHEGNNLEI